MSKIETPMKRVSNNMNVFKLLTEPYFKHVVLNKAQSRYNPVDYERTKGVESDFISIFKSTSSKQSLAFIFNYINKQPEDYSVEASIKDEFDEINSSISMPLSEFKLKLNQLNKSLSAKPYVLEQHIWTEFTTIFNIKPVNIKAEVISAQKTYNENLIEKEKILDLPSKEKAYLKSKSQLEKAIDLKKVTLSNSSEAQAVADLKKKLEIAQRTLTQKSKNIENSLNISTLIKQVDNHRRDFELAKTELEKFSIEEKNKLPKHVSKRIKVK